MAPQEPEQDASWVRTDGHLWARSGKASLHGRGPAGHWPPRIQETPSHKERVLPQQLSRPAVSPKSEWRPFSLSQQNTLDWSLPDDPARGRCLGDLERL